MESMRRNRFACLAASVCLVALLPSLAGAWGREGHRIVARIGAKHLSSKTQTAISNLLKADPDDRDHCNQKTSIEDKLACVATWADEVRSEKMFGFTAPYHFVNIPVYAAASQRHYIASRDCGKGACVIQALAKYRAILLDQSRSASSRAIALKFIVHFIGDLHQPLHDAVDHDRDAANKENGGKKPDKGDRGANLKLVTWLGQESNEFGCWNLHAVWDEGIIEKKDSSDESFANSLEGAVDPQKIASIQKGTTVNWANEAFRLAISHSYKLPKPTSTDKVCEVKVGDKRECEKFSADVCNGAEVHYRYHLDQAYNDSNLPIVETQLTNAGLRLGKFLNGIFEASSGAHSKKTGPHHSH